MASHFIELGSPISATCIAMRKQRLCLLLRRKLAEIGVDDVRRRTITESTFVANITEVMLAFGDKCFVKTTGHRAGLERIDVRSANIDEILLIMARTAVPVTRGPEPLPPLGLPLAAGSEEAAAGAEETVVADGAALLTGSAPDDIPPETLTGADNAGAEEAGTDPAGVDDG